MQIVITDMEDSTAISITGDGQTWTKSYPSWENALDEALRLNLITSAAHADASSLPPAFPYYGTVESQQISLPEEPAVPIHLAA